MKIAIIGSGAMGSIYGGILAEAGNEVHLIDVFQAHIDKINKDGLCIVNGGNERYIKNIKATKDPEEVGKVDLAIVFVKSTITGIAVKGNSSVLDEDTTVLTLQNGLGNIEKINEVVDSQQIVAGTSTNGGSMVEPGKVNHAGSGGTIIGEINGKVTGRIENLRDTLDLEDLGPCTVSENVMGLIWDKLLVNVGINPLTAVTGLKNGELLDYEESIEILESLVGEGVEVARASGINIGRDAISHCKDVCRQTAENTSSMLADVENKRKTEIENINGAIVREGAKFDIETSVNRTMANLVKVKEKTYSKGS